MIDPKNPADIAAATEVVKAASDEQNKQDKTSTVLDALDVGTTLLGSAVDAAGAVAGAAVEGVGTLATGAVEVVGTILGGLVDL